jgi:signal transduction histidine kinase
MTPRILVDEGPAGGRRTAAKSKKAAAAGRHIPADLDSTNSLLVHDIKNLSFRLCSLLQNLENNYEDPLFKKSVVDILNDTVSRMDRIIHRCQGPREELIVKYPIDLNEVLNELVENLPQAVQKRFFIEESYERIPKIWADPKYLKEGFIIVLDTALDSMSERGDRLLIATTSLVTRTGKRKVVVKIADSGCGMSREFIKNHLFAPFISTKDHGLGLGMYACRKIVGLHDGTIRVTSREGQGTTFRIDFPAAR